MKKTESDQPKVEIPVRSAAWWIKIVIFGLLLVGAGCFLGLVLRLCGDSSMHFIGGSGDLWDLLWLACWALGALLAVAVAAGIIAVLVRLYWVAAIMFFISALTLFLCWEISLPSLIVALVYFVIGLVYLAGVRSEINNRVKFRTWNIRPAQSTLLIILAALVCAGIYFGFARSIDRNGFTLSPDIIDWAMDLADDHLDTAIDMIAPGEEISADDREAALAEIRNFLENDLSTYESYGKYAPMMIAGIVFAEFIVLIMILGLLPPLILWLIFLILVASKVIRKRTHSIQVVRLSME